MGADKNAKTETVGEGVAAAEAPMGCRGNVPGVGPGDKERRSSVFVSF